MNIFEKVSRRITRLSWNHTVHHIILEAMKRRIITSKQGHAILGAWNAECFPERGHASFMKAVEHTLAGGQGCTCGAKKAPAFMGVPHLKDCPCYRPAAKA